jgi:hypothetical protein
MALLNNKRQETAQRLTRELQAFGATVTSVLPLADGQNLRFWVSDYKKNELLQQLKDAGYDAPVFLGMSPQLCIESYSMGLVNNFELPLSAERQEIPRQGVIPKDAITDREKDLKMKREVAAMYEAIYGKRR